MTDQNLEGRVMIISPVRNCPDEVYERLLAHCAELEQKKPLHESVGWRPYLPKDDTDQNDPVGLTMCTTTRFVMRNATQVGVYYDPTSEGVVFDLGMAFMAKKPLYVINEEDVRQVLEKNPGDDFARLVLKCAYNADSALPFPIYEAFLERRRTIETAELVQLRWGTLSRSLLFDFGMAFMAEKPIVLTGTGRPERTPYKSFENVLLELDAQAHKTTRKA